MQIRDIITEQIHYVRPGELRGSYTDRQMTDMGFSKSSRGVWYIDQRRWDELIRSGVLREGDVIRTKFATKQAQQARDQYQRQPDIADSIPLYDPKRRMAVLPQHASDDAEPFDHFYAEPRSERTSQIIGVTRGGKKIVTSTWMAPVETVAKVADAYNRGGFSDVPMSRVPIRGYDDVTENSSDTQKKTAPGSKLVIFDIDDTLVNTDTRVNVVRDSVASEYHRSDVKENFADGKIKGKSRPGRVKRAGASCKGSVSDLRARAKKYSGERGKMYQWCLNMKAGKK